MLQGPLLLELVFSFGTWCLLGKSARVSVFRPGEGPVEGDAELEMRPTLPRTVPRGLGSSKNDARFPRRAFAWQGNYCAEDSTGDEVPRFHSVFVELHVVIRPEMGQVQVDPVGGPCRGPSLSCLSCAFAFIMGVMLVLVPELVYRWHREPFFPPRVSRSGAHASLGGKARVLSFHPLANMAEILSAVSSPLPWYSGP